jgi:hypothetical protein
MSASKLEAQAWGKLSEPAKLEHVIWLAGERERLEKALAAALDEIAARDRVIASLRSELRHVRSTLSSMLARLTGHCEKES